MMQPSLFARWLSIRDVPRQLTTFPARRLMAASRHAAHTKPPISFSGTWSVRYDSVTRCDSVFSEAPGSAIHLTVVGDVFALLLGRNDYCALLSLQCGGRTLPLDTFITRRDPDKALCVVDGLGPGEHEVVISIVGASPRSAGSQVWLREVMVPLASEAPFTALLETGRRAVRDWAALPPLRHVANMHLLDTYNTGDLASTPVQYVPFLAAARSVNLVDWHPLRMGRALVDPISIQRRQSYFEALNSCDIIIGGGGLLQTPWFDESIEVLQSGSKRKLIIWGAGHNGTSTPWDSHSRFNSFDLTLDRFELIGVRDYGSRFQWVPCPSCLHPGFDRPYEVRREIGFYLHPDRAIKQQLARTLPPGDLATNDIPVDDALRFLGESEYVVTDSYHGAYWGTLLGRKMLCVPSSSKFFSLKHPVPPTGYFDWRTAMPLARSYPEALAECREANLKFAAQVYDVLA